MDRTVPGFNRRDLLRYTTLGAAGLAAGSLGLLSGCSSSSGTSSGTHGGSAPIGYGPPQGGTPKKGGTLRVGLITGGSAETVDVRLAATVIDISRVQSLYDPLWFVGTNGQVLPGLAKSWSTNATADVWTIQTQQGVEWHDGKPFSSADVVYTIKNSWGSPKNLFNYVLAEIVDFANVRADGPNTVVIPLKRRLAQFPTIPTIQNCYIVQDGYTDWNQPVGTGPFKYGSFTPGSSSNFPANPNYWRGNGPHVDALYLDSTYQQDEARFNALLAGNIDVMPALPPVFAKELGNKKIYIGNETGPGWTGPTFRVDTGPLRDLRVRKALKLAFDRKTAVDVVLDGYGVPGNDCCGYTDQYFANDLTSHYDPEQAKSLLKSAGYDSPLALTLTTSALAQNTTPLATLFAQQATPAGFDITVKQESPAVFFTPAGGYQTRPLAMELWTNGANSLSIFYLLYLVTGAPYTDTHWGDPASDALAYDAMAETDPSKAADKWHAVQVLQNEQGGVLNINYNWFDGYGPNVRGLRTTNAGNCDNFVYTPAWLES